MTGPIQGTRERNTLGSLAEATLEVIDQLSAGDLLAAVTPERLGQATGYAPSSIRYQLSRLQREAETETGGAGVRPAAARTRWSFDREQLLLLALDALMFRQLEAAERLTETYLDALGTLEQTGDLTALGLAIKANLDTFTPGATGDEKAGATERVWAVALAAADGSKEVARRLRGTQDGQIERYLPVHELGLRLTNRELRPGVSLMGLAKQVNVFIEGVATRRRFEPTFDESLVLQSVLAIFYGHTRPVQDPGMPSPAEILATAAQRGV